METSFWLKCVVFYRAIRRDNGRSEQQEFHAPSANQIVWFQLCLFSFSLSLSVSLSETSLPSLSIPADPLSVSHSLFLLLCMCPSLCSVGLSLSLLCVTLLLPLLFSSLSPSLSLTHIPFHCVALYSIFLSSLLSLSHTHTFLFICAKEPEASVSSLHDLSVPSFSQLLPSENILVYLGNIIPPL